MQEECKAEQLTSSIERQVCLDKGALLEVKETDDPMIWDVKETFRDRASFNAHQERTRNSLWFAATRDIQRDFHLEDSSD